jgi:hypothetical protein
MKRDSIKLSDVQAEMLLFFAGQRRTPSGDTRTTAALITRGLLARGNNSDRYETTEFGEQVAARLARTLTRTE